MSQVATAYYADQLEIGDGVVALGHRTRSADRPHNGLNAPVAPASGEELRLIKRLRNGDEAAFDELVTRHHGSLIRLAMAYVPDRAIAEEVVQDTWLAVVESLDQFEGRSSLRTWIFAILIHKAKDRGRRESRHAFVFSARGSGDGREEQEEAFSAVPQPWDPNTPEAELLSKEGAEFLERSIQALPPTLREALVLRDVEDMDSKEICALLGISESNLYVRLHRARTRLHQQAKQYLEEGLMPV